MARKTNENNEITKTSKHKNDDNQFSKISNHNYEKVAC